MPYSHVALVHFLSLNPKTGTPSPTEHLSYDDPDYKPKKETSDNEFWRSGKRDKYILITSEKSGMMNTYWI